MSEILVCDIRVDKLSRCGRQLLKAALLHARAHPAVKYHELPLVEFCIHANTSAMSGADVRVLLSQAQASNVAFEVIEIKAGNRNGILYKSSSLLGSVFVNDYLIEFEVPEFILRDAVLGKVLAMCDEQKSEGEHRDYSSYAPVLGF